MASKVIQYRGGTTTEHATFVGADREVTVDTTKKTLVIHDGITVGGTPLAKASDITTINAALTGKQPIDADLTAIAGLVDTSGLLKKTAANTWTLDKTVYAPNTHVGATGTAHGNATTTVAGFMSNTDKVKLDGIAAGAQVNVATDLSLGTATATTIPLNSSTGTNVTLPAVTTTTAGLMGSADKTKLDGIAAGAQVNVATDLSLGTATATTIPLNSSTGTNVTLPAVTTTTAGLMGSADKVKLDGIGGLSSTLPVAAGTATVGTATTAARADHVHPAQTTAVTPAYGDKSTAIATTDFVQETVGGYLNKSKLTGGTLTLTDIEVSNAVLAFSGTLTSNLIIVVPTTNRRIWAAINGTTGAFTLTVKTAAGTGVTIAQGKRNLIYTDGTNVADAFNDFESIALTGVPTAPTAAAGTNNTQVATTAFVMANSSNTLADLGVTATATELNKLDGISSNITVAEINFLDGVTSAIQTQLNAKAALASPALTGVPTAPTAAAGTNTTQVATTAFVLANSSNLTSTTVGTATAGISAGAVGSYVFAYRSSTGSAINIGGTVAGSQLRTACTARMLDNSNGLVGLSSSTALTGTWRCMGYSYSGYHNSLGAESYTLWLRIA